MNNGEINSRTLRRIKASARSALACGLIIGNHQKLLIFPLVAHLLCNIVCRGRFGIIFKKFLCNNNKYNVNKEFLPTPTQMQIIAYIMAHENEEIYQKNLENVLKLTRATVSGVLQTMEKNSLIERVVDSNDTRGKKIILNKEAEEVFKKNKIKLDKVEEILKKDIDKDSLETFFKVIIKMKENAESYDIITLE